MHALYKSKTSLIYNCCQFSATFILRYLLLCCVYGRGIPPGANANANAVQASHIVIKICW